MNQNHRPKPRALAASAAVAVLGLCTSLLTACGGGSTEPVADAVATPDAVEVVVGQQSALAADDSTEPVALTLLSTPGSDTTEPKPVQ